MRASLGAWMLPLAGLVGGCADPLPGEDPAAAFDGRIDVHFRGECPSAALAHGRGGRPRALDVEPARDRPVGFVDVAVDWPALQVLPGHIGLDAKVAPEPVTPSDACLDVRVEGADGRVFWSRHDLCGTSYGSVGGGEAWLTVIAPCDAGPAGRAPGRLVVSMTRACLDGGELAGLALPCADGCARAFTCVGDADTALTVHARP